MTDPTSDREEVERLLEASLQRRERRLPRRELRVELALAAVFAVLAGTLALVAPGGLAADPIAVALVAAFAVASRVNYPIATGVAVPTQLFLVALFAYADAALVPLLVLAGLALGTGWAAATGRSRWDRLLQAPGDAMYALGAAAVLLASGHSGARTAPLLVIAAAFAAQCVVELSASAARDWLAEGIRPRIQVLVLPQVWAVDAALTPIGLLGVLATDEVHWAPLAALPLVALVARVARDRAERTDRLRHRLDALREERRRLQVAVRRIGDAFASNLDLDALVEIVARAAGEALHADAVRAGVVLGDTVVPRVADGAAADWAGLLADADGAALAAGAVASARAGERWAVAAPIGPRHAPVAVVTLGRATPFDAQELELLAYLCEQAAVAADNVVRHERLHQQALTDELTGLANHRRLQELLADATAEHRGGGLGVALVLLDLDDFKQVNDRHGHQTGDQVLRAVGRCLRAHCRGSDEPARYGGEELAVVLVDADADRAVTLAERLRQSVETLLVQDADGERIPLTVSVGVAVAGPDTATPATLIAAADRALYDAKLGGKNAVRLARHDAAPDRTERRRVDTEHDMRGALHRDELVLHYQPKVSLTSGAVVGVEALVRWRHPERGMLGPGRFIPALEGTELMEAFTSWVLERALRQAGDWRRAGRPLPVAVNVTAHDVDDPGLPERIGALLAATGAEPQDLRLEITEHTAMSDADGAAATLGALRDLGIGLSLDDFGSGYSSLTRLRVLPVDELKLDRSFLVDAREVDLVVVRAAISIARDLGLTIVAEGVEDSRRLQVLCRLGCDLAQGFHIAPPLMPDELQRWLAARSVPGWGLLAPSR